MLTQDCERVGSKHVGLGGRVESVPWRAAGPTTEFPEFPWCDSDTPTSASWIYILPFSFLKKYAVWEPAI